MHHDAHEEFNRRLKKILDLIEKTDSTELIG